jgi:hypothetical protein
MTAKRIVLTLLAAVAMTLAAAPTASAHRAGAHPAAINCPPPVPHISEC